MTNKYQSGTYAKTVVLIAFTVVLGRETSRAQLQPGPNFEVNALGDSDDGSCRGLGDGDCTLREAVNAANSNADASVISFAPSLAGQTISLLTVADTTFGPSALAVTTPVHIEGPAGNSGVTVARDNSVARLRLFYVSPSGNLTLTTLTLSNGKAQGFDGAVKLPFTTSGGEGGGGGAAGLGGAIFNQGSLTIEQSTLTANLAQGGNGGAAGPVAFSSNGSGGGGLNGDGNPGDDGNAATSTDRSGGAGGGGDGGYMFGAVSGDTGLVVFGRNAGFGGGGGGGSFSCAPFPPGTDCFGRNGGNGGFGAGGGGGAGLPQGANAGAGGFGGGNGGNGGGAFGGSGGGGGGGLGGAVFNHGGTVAIVNSTISGNTVQGGNGGNGDASGFGGDGGSAVGGGLFNLNGVVSITNSTFADNTALRGNGGLASAGGGAGAANGAARGGAIYNLAHEDATGIDEDDAVLLLQNTILADSTADEDLVNEQRAPTAVVQAVAPNIVESSITNLGGQVDEGGVNHVDPNLAPLAANGGPTLTHALRVSPAFSAAIDAGFASGSSTDQRGRTRPVNHPSVGNSNDGSDIGAFEVQLDSDGDWIFDEVDEAPLTASIRFSDRPSGGRTSGRIANRPAGMTVQIVDHPNPDKGVRVTLSGAQGQRATLRLDGKSSSIQLRSPGIYTVTDPDTVTSVAVDVGGPAQLEVLANGVIFIVEISVGGEARITETDRDGNGTVESVKVERLAGQVTVDGALVDPGGLTVGTLLNTKLAIQKRLRTFELIGTFVPPGTIDPRGETVSIRIATLVMTIPPGSFALKRGVHLYAGTIGGVRLVASVTPQRNGRFAVVVLGYGPNFAGTVNPVPVQIAVGDDSGTQSVRAVIR